MSTYLPSFLLGFHGCDHDVAEKILAGDNHLRASNESYDWLGHGIYFWENDPDRAMAWAVEKMKRARPKDPNAIKKPAVVGAIIDPGHSFNLFSSDALTVLKETHRSFVKTYQEAEVQLPKNQPLRESGDLLLRHLDCAVIEYMHKMRAAAGLNSYDSVRGVFFEGDDLYENAGFKEKNHVQICVCSKSCIKGYFRILPDVSYE